MAVSQSLVHEIEILINIIRIRLDRDGSPECENYLCEDLKGSLKIALLI
jgi:hypothetical protein